MSFPSRTFEQIPEPDHPVLARIAERFGVDGVGLASPTKGWICSVGLARPLDPLTGTSRGQGLVQTDRPFLLAVPIAALWAGPDYWLVLWDSRPRPAAEAHHMLARATELASQVALDRILAAESYRQRLFERASATARIGVWACRLPDEVLTWSNGVYDLFELPRGALVTRSSTLEMYLPESRRQLQQLRDDAIAARGDFALDAQIVTAKGRHRWIRITAAVESRGQDAVSIFGMKQDITEEKILAEQTRRLAETDVLTGLANRSLFQQKLDLAGTSPSARTPHALLLIDLDNFKHINDTLGHAQGDACLVETARRLRACSPPDALVARIGGDEFAILVAGDTEPQALAHRIVEALHPPFLLGCELHQIGASVGVAEWTGQEPDTLYRNADTALYAAKSGGRNTWRAYEAA